MRKQEQHSVMVKNLRVRESKIHAQRERDRHKEYVSIQGVQQLQNDNNLLKVRKSLYIVTFLGKLPFMLFT